MLLKPLTIVENRSFNISPREYASFLLPASLVHFEGVLCLISFLHIAVVAQPLQMLATPEVSIESNRTVEIPGELVLLVVVNSLSEN